MILIQTDCMITIYKEMQFTSNLSKHFGVEMWCIICITMQNHDTLYI